MRKLIVTEKGKLRIASGVGAVDRLLGGLFVGDNVVWYDEAGSLAASFCRPFLEISLAHRQPLIYVTFDRSPNTLLARLAGVPNSDHLTILDCFTWGKGEGSAVFRRFYEEPNGRRTCRVVPVHEPQRADRVADALFEVHESHEGNVRFIFESLTGMAELWGGEEELIGFYSHTCPRLYELETVAYWIIERKAHTARLRAQINQIAQVVINLSTVRGSPALALVKAENRAPQALHRQHAYRVTDGEIVLEEDRRAGQHANLGARLRHFRTRQGLSQKDLAKLVGVTPSAISQTESNRIYPSIPALVKMAEVLSTDVSGFFRDVDDDPRVVFPSTQFTEVDGGDAPDGVRILGLKGNAPTGKAEPYLIEVLPRRTISTHFATHKGEETGFVLAGRLEMRLRNVLHRLQPGDLIHLSFEVPTQWRNPGRSPARLLWFKLR